MKDIVIQRISCEISTYNGQEDSCQWCGTDLVNIARRTVWCSNSCYLAWRKNHIWRFARAAARRRDKYQCVVCGLSRKDGHQIEVNHIEPLVGRGYHYGCVHHLSNLETLCKEHHQVKTNEQRNARKSTDTL